jgi:hypothetical protein
MGAWDAGPFDNDDAVDWAAEFDNADKAAGTERLRTALQAASADYLEAPEGAVAVAAAQVVAWLGARLAELVGSPSGRGPRFGCADSTRSSAERLV